MTDMQVAVGFGREAGVYALLVFAAFVVFFYNLLNKIEYGRVVGVVRFEVGT